jgi:hypothetical protein
VSEFLWVIIAVIGVLVAWWLFKIALSFVVPQRVSGIALLKQELARRRIPHAHLPHEFFEECVNWAERASAFSPGQSVVTRKAEFVRTIESLGYTIELWRNEPNSPIFSAFSPGGYRALFEKYSLRDAV